MTDLEAVCGNSEPAEAPLIPVDKVIIRWNCAPGTEAVSKVRVTHYDDEPPGTEGTGYNSGGYGDFGWLTDPLGIPLGVFATLLVLGFASRDDMQTALHHFRNVQGQEIWATFLLLQSHDPNIGRILDQEETEGKRSDTARNH